MRQNHFRAFLLIASASFVTSCSCGDSGQQYIDVTVEHPASLSSICVKVTATSDTLSKETAPMSVSGDAKLKVAIYRDNLPSIVTLKAVGYSDANCSTPSVPAEESRALRAGFATVPAPFTLSMEKATGADLDRDGFSPPDDCDDSDPAIHPGVAERCTDGVDNDCNGARDCVDTTCDLQNCGTGAVCMSAVCVETNCSDRADGDRDGTIDCADSDCATKACSLSGTGASCVGTRCVEQMSACNNGVDDDQDGETDCRDSDCLGASCGTGGTCVAAVDGGAPARCLEPNETLCGDGADNDGDNAIDCMDTDCNTHACNDSNACTTGETCMGMTCGGGTMTVCNMPASACFAPNGVCNPSDGQCRYSPVAAMTMCVDGDPCTEPDRCDGDGGCTSSPKMCPPPPSGCFAAGVCQASLDGGCTYAVMAGNGCSDNNNCTVGDSCGADGGCASGSLVTCTPAECRTFTAGSCDTNGVCQFGNAGPGTTCDGGSCNGSGVCVPTGVDAGMDAGVDAGVDAGMDAGVDAGTDAGSFPYAVDNVVVANHPPSGAFVVDCALTLNSSTGFGAPCSGGSVPSLQVADGGSAGELAVFSVSSLFVTDAGSITMSGSRPVVFLVWGDATVSGQLLANSTRASAGRVGPGASNVGANCVGRIGGAGSASSQSRGGGGGGAGYFSNGGLGGGASNEAATRGDAGVLTMGGDVPLFIGCPGGTGSTDGTPTAGGVGGGALQLSVAGTATLNAIVSTSGQGGRGGAGGSEPGGGGGGSGGALLIQANRLIATMNARLTSNGGAGGGGAQGNTATNGADGTTNNATPATGGANEGGGGPGGAGGAGGTAPVAGTTVFRGGGGGGGAAGRIFLKHYDSGNACSVNAGTISPAAQRTNCP
ncbi:MAG: MopE-related protein [Archangium sp.]